MEFIEILEKILQDKTRVNKDTVYNEASLQHELGYYLKEKKHTVKFEIPMCKIDEKWQSGSTVKKEIDLIINDNIAIELKYPAKKAPANESYWHFLEDISFLQELVKNDYTITKGYFIVLLNKEY